MKSAVTPSPIRRSILNNQSVRRHRCEFVHGEDADFVAYQRGAGNGRSQTVSSWMIPSADHR
jgi:hypothetical protein